MAFNKFSRNSLNSREKKFKISIGLWVVVSVKDTSAERAKDTAVLEAQEIATRITKQTGISVVADENRYHTKLLYTNEV